MVRIRNLYLEYSEGFSLFIDKLFIEEGKIFTFIGPNGAGKTTLLNIIALFEKPKTGSIEIFGQDILNIKDKLSFRRSISFVFSQPYLLNDTVYNNIALPLRLRGNLKKANIQKICDFFKIAHLKERNALKISQGEKHRVALARAFVTEPKLVLMDEPFLSLDAGYKESLIVDLRRIIKMNRITTFFVTQDRLEALSIADEMAMMKAGRILQQASPLEVFNRPVSKEVADFVGIETIVEGNIFKKEDNLCFVRVNSEIIEAISGYNVDDDVFICIRPEDVVVLKTQDSGSCRNLFKARIIKIEPRMLEYKLTLDAGFNLVSFVSRQSIENLNLKVGEYVFVAFKATAIHLIKR
jgi:tungstate transport system ATP-binding protein